MDAELTPAVNPDPLDHAVLQRMIEDSKNDRTILVGSDLRYAASRAITAENRVADLRQCLKVSQRDVQRLAREHEAMHQYLRRNLPLCEDPVLRIGDHALHLPSGETWVICRVTPPHIWAGGWPCTRAHLRHMLLVYACTDAEHEAQVEACRSLPADDERHIPSPT